MTPSVVESRPRVSEVLTVLTCLGSVVVGALAETCSTVLLRVHDRSVVGRRVSGRVRVFTTADVTSASLDPYTGPLGVRFSHRR